MRHRTASLCTLYFLAFTSTYTWTIFPRTLEAVGWTGASIGLLYSARKAIDIPSLWIWGALADRHDPVRLIQIQLAIGLIAGLLAALFLESTFDALMVIGILLFSATASSIFPIADSLTISTLGASRFGFVRSFGSAGYAVMALFAALLGWYLSDYARFSMFALPILVFTMALALIASFFLPSPEKKTEQAPSFKDLMACFERPMLVALLVLGALHWACQTPLNLFLVALCEHRNLPVWSSGLGIFIGVTFEVFVLAGSTALLRFLRPSAWLLISFVFGAVRWWAMSEVTSVEAMLALQALHGLSFGTFFMASIALLTREVPDRLRSSGQALFYVVVFGVGSILGNVVTGYLFEHHGVLHTFEMSALVEIFLLIPGAFFAWRVVTR